MANTVKCPSCGSPIEITEALQRSVTEQIQKEFEEKNQIELADLQKSVAEKDAKLKIMQEEELKLRAEKRRLEDKEKEMDLEVARKVDAHKKEFEDEAVKKYSEDNRLKMLEKEKQIEDMARMIEELKRKSQITSQQLQGEVLELDLEELLRNTFPQDGIDPVGKGIRGADIRQTVKSPKQGAMCGVILWESKRTKTWSDDWIIKLKDDLRAEAANIPIIVTSVLPKTCEKGMGLLDGVWVVSFTLVIPLAMILRKNLIEVAYQKYVSADSGRKADMIYQYLTSHVFSQQVEAMTEVFSEMREQIAREKIAYEKSWKVREAQIYRMMKSTAKIYGSLQGLAGNALPSIKDLDLPELE